MTGIGSEPTDHLWKEDKVDHANDNTPGRSSDCPGMSQVSCCSAIASESALVLRDHKHLPVWADSCLKAHKLRHAVQLLLALLRAHMLFNLLVHETSRASVMP